MRQAARSFGLTPWYRRKALARFSRKRSMGIHRGHEQTEKPYDCQSNEETLGVHDVAKAPVTGSTPLSCANAALRDSVVLPTTQHCACSLLGTPPSRIR